MDRRHTAQHEHTYTVISMQYVRYNGGAVWEEWWGTYTRSQAPWSASAPSNRWWMASILISSVRILPAKQMPKSSCTFRKRPLGFTFAAAECPSGRRLMLLFLNGADAIFIHMAAQATISTALRRHSADSLWPVPIGICCQCPRRGRARMRHYSR